MKIQYCSDLHLEFTANRNFLEENPLYPEGDILLLAGDITNLDMIDRHSDFFNYVSDEFEHVFWIPGNHEYYKNDLASHSGTFEESIRANITLLNNSVVEWHGARLIFSTLWSSISLSNAWRVERSLNDFYQITDNGQRFTSQRYNELHNDAVNFLTDELKLEKHLPTIVVTHHAPTFELYPPEYLGDFLNEAFATELRGLIEEGKPDYWVFGHHHRNMDDFKIDETTLTTNQLGYVQSNEHRGFRRDRLIII